MVIKKFLVLAMAALTVSTSAQNQTASADAATAETLFRNVRVFDGQSPELSAPTNVLVRGNLIVEIGAGARSTSGTTINGNGRTLMPGLIDAHTHLFMAATAQADMLAPDATFESLTEAGAAEAERVLMRGFTSVRDVGGSVIAIKRGIDAGRPGPRIYSSESIISQTSGHGDFRLPEDRSRRFGGTVTQGELFRAGFIADGRDEVLTATRENLRSGASQIKLMAGGGAATVYDPLDVTQYTLDEMRAAVEAAEDWGTYVTAHAYTPRAVRRAVEAGIKCIEHGQLLDEPTMQLLAERGVWLSLQTLDPAPPTAPQSTRQKKQTVIDGTDNAYRWARQYGVRLAWGTDLMFNAAQMDKQNTDIPKLSAWFTPAEALSMITYSNAQLLALSGNRNPYPGALGVVQEGALADLLLVEGNPLQDLTIMANPGRNFRVIMKDGRIFKNNLT